MAPHTCSAAAETYAVRTYGSWECAPRRVCGIHTCGAHTRVRLMSAWLAAPLHQSHQPLAGSSRPHVGGQTARVQQACCRRTA